MVHTRLMSHVVTGVGENSAVTSMEVSLDAGQPKFIRHINDKPQEGTVAIYDSNKRAINLLQLPTEIVEKILSYVPYRTVCHLRAVSRKMDEICSGHLNVSFHRLQSSMLARFQGLKAQMPRRESSRRHHPLACESEIVETLHMRLTLLQMTFGKHIERKHVCFFAGDILDEVYRILHYVSATPSLARPYKVTDELFDLSTMAMEYFKERIEPTLPDISCFSSDFLDFANPFNSSSNGLDDSTVLDSYKDDVTPPLPQRSTMVLRKRIRRIKQGMKKYNNQLSILRRDIRTCKGKGMEQQKQLLDITSRLDDHDKKNEETSRKFSTLLQELNKCKTELQYWRFKAPTIPLACTSCGRLFPPPAPNGDLANHPLPLPWLEMGAEIPEDALANLMPLPWAGNEDWNLDWDPTLKKVEESAPLKVSPPLEVPSESASDLVEECSMPEGAGLPKDAKPDSPKEQKGKEGKFSPSLLKRKPDDISKDTQDPNAKKPKRILKARKK